MHRLGAQQQPRRQLWSADQVADDPRGGGIALLGFGALRDATESWTVPVLALIGVMLVQLTAGLIAARSRFVDDEIGAPVRPPVPAPPPKPT